MTKYSEDATLVDQLFASSIIRNLALTGLIGSSFAIGLYMGTLTGFKRGYAAGRFDERTAHYVMQNVPEADGHDIVLERHAGKEGELTQIYVTDLETGINWRMGSEGYTTGIDAGNDGMVKTTSCTAPISAPSYRSLQKYNNPEALVILEHLALEAARSE